MEEIPDTQRAWVVVRQCTPSQALELKSDWPVPKKLTVEGEVLLKVHAAELNPVGSKLMKILPNFIPKRPHVTEQNFSGVVVDGNETNFSKGDAVYRWIPRLQQKTRQGAQTVYLWLPANGIVARPAGVTPIQVSGITFTCLTSHQALMQTGKLEAEQTGFINGGSAALGAFAIQIAKAKGAKVVATASGKNEDFARGMGADEFVDYAKTGPPRTYPHKTPLQRNAISFTTLLVSSNLHCSQKAQILLNACWVVHPIVAGRRQPPLHAIIMVEHSSAEAKGVRQLLENSRPNSSRRTSCLFTPTKFGRSVKPIVDSVYDFNDDLKAYDRIATKRATGKIVIEVDPLVD